MKDESYWRKHLEALKRSGLSVAEYCRREGLADSRVFYWRSKLEGQEAGFVKVGRREVIEIELTSGAKVKLPGDISGDNLKVVLEAVNAVAS